MFRSTWSYLEQLWTLMDHHGAPGSNFVTLCQDFATVVHQVAPGEDQGKNVVHGARRRSRTTKSFFLMACVRVRGALYPCIPGIKLRRFAVFSTHLPKAKTYLIGISFYRLAQFGYEGRTSYYRCHMCQEYSHSCAT